MTRFKVDFDGIMDRLEELERENHRLQGENAKLDASVSNSARVIVQMWNDITAMRPIVEAVAEARWGAYPSGEHLYGIGDAFRLRAQARAFVAAHPAPAEREAE